MSKARDINRLIQSQSEFRKRVLAFPARSDYKGWVINKQSVGFAPRFARLQELVALLLSRNEDGILKLKPPSAEKVDSYCHQMMQMALEYFKKHPGAAQISVLAPCVTLEGESMMHWFMFYNERMFASINPSSCFNVIEIDHEPESLLQAVGLMAVKGDPVEVLRMQVAKQTKVELKDPRTDGLRQDALGDMFETQEDLRTKILNRLHQADDAPQRYKQAWGDSSEDSEE